MQPPDRGRARMAPTLYHGPDIAPAARRRPRLALAHRVPSPPVATASTREVTRVKRKLYGAGIAVGALMMVTGTVLTVPASDVAAQAEPANEAAQQAQPSPSPAAKPAAPTPAAKPAAPAQAPAAKPAAPPAAKPVVTPAAKPAATPATAPRAGGFPVELAMPLVAGGAAVASAGVFMLRRGRRKD